jgi:hypothetical protein
MLTNLLLINVLNLAQLTIFNNENNRIKHIA